jgi:CubicO group peptidase (beta-lactamase class C family)
MYRAAFVLALLASTPVLADDMPMGDPEAAGLNLAPLAQLPAAISRGEFPRTNAVLVMKNGRLVYEAYFGEGSQDALHDSRSAMKSVTSLAIGLAIADGAIRSVSQSAFELLDHLRPFANDSDVKRAITIQDLLTMSSALACDDDDPDSPGNEAFLQAQRDWARWVVDLPTSPEYRRDASGLGPWHYCTAGTFLLGRVLEAAMDGPADEYIEQRLFEPLDIHDWYFPHTPSGEHMTGGGIRLRARDLAKLAWLLVDRGWWHGKHVVPDSWIDAALTPRRTAYEGTRYGYLFWQQQYRTTCGTASAWYMAGNGGNAILAFRELGAAVVIARANYNAPGMHEETEAMLVKHILPSLLCRAPNAGQRP